MVHSSQTSRAGRLDGAKRQKVDEVLDASDSFDIYKPMSEIDMSSGAVQPEADLEGGTLIGNGDLGEEAGHVTTDSSSSDTDDGERELDQTTILSTCCSCWFHACSTSEIKASALHQEWKLERACMWQNETPCLQRAFCAQV